MRFGETGKPKTDQLYGMLAD